LVAYALIAQQTPRAVTDAPPSEEILPPKTTAVDVIEMILVVINVAPVIGLVVKETILP
jgi:hypothetical protein